MEMVVKKEILGGIWGLIVRDACVSSFVSRIERVKV